MATKTISLSNALLMLTLITFWGSSFVVAKIVLREELTPVALATFRFLIAGGLSLAVLLFKKSQKRDYNLFIEKKDAPTLLFLALSGVTLFFAAQYTGIKMAGAAIAAIFVCLLSPILITVFSTRIFKENLDRKQIFGIGIAATGTLIVITSGVSFQSNKEFFFGSLILLSTPILWTAYSLFGKKTIEKYNPFLVVTYVNALGGLFLIPFSLAENSLQQIFTMSLNSWLAVLFLSITCSLLGYNIWFYVLKQVGAAVTSSFLFAEPLITMLFAVTLVGEEITFSISTGGLLIFTGVYLVTKKQRTHKRFTTN
ncbi:MAG: EamA family transporter [Candidatus Bathyarchaeota archaeon]|nr:EamA family transporter [Candidatus Bathyarchaeota archaeon]